MPAVLHGQNCSRDNDFTAEDRGWYCSNSISPANKNTDYFIIKIRKKLWHQFKMHPRDLSSELSTARSDNLSFLLSINYIPLTTEPQKTIYGFNKIKGIVLVSQIIFLRTRALGRE